MIKSLVKELDEKIYELKDIITNLNTENVLTYFASSFKFPFLNIFENTQLSSPYMQSLYLIGLLLSTEKKSNKELELSTIVRMKKLLEEIVWQYFFIFLPKVEETDKELSEKWFTEREISMPVFLDFFNTGYRRNWWQLKKRIESWYLNYNDFIKSNVGISVEELMNIFFSLLKYLQGKGDYVEDKLKKELYMLITNRRYSKEAMKMLNDLYTIKINDLKDKFNSKVILKFLNIFSIERENRDFFYYTELNPYSLSPIWRRDKEHIFLAFPDQLLNAMYDFLYDHMEKSEFRENFYKKRKKESESKCMELYKKMFLDDADYYEGVFETPDSQNEHDGLVIFEGNLIIIEVKSSKVKEPFRDPEKCFVRLKRDFKSDRGLQKAYDQGLNLKNLILSNEKTVLFNSNGDSILELKRKDIKNVFINCITAEPLSFLAVNLSLFLDKPAHEPYPWASNLFDLETLIDGFDYLNKTPHDFLEYLKLREKYHQKFYTIDELEIAGFFLNKGEFEKFIDCDKICFPPGMANIFDNIYIRQGRFWDFND